MIGKFFPTLVAGSLLCCGAAGAGCNYPPEVSVPSGKTVSEQELAEASKAVTGYMDAMRAYQECIDKEQAELGDSATPEQKAMHVKKYNASVDAMQTLAARFNEEVRAFKARKK
jgi:hypothetical protein